MSETEGDRAYFAAAEAAFIARRGTPFLLSPKDFALLKEWHALGVSLPRGTNLAFRPPRCGLLPDRYRLPLLRPASRAHAALT